MHKRTSTNSVHLNPFIRQDIHSKQYSPKNFMRNDHETPFSNGSGKRKQSDFNVDNVDLFHTQGNDNIIIT